MIRGNLFKIKSSKLRPYRCGKNVTGRYFQFPLGQTYILVANIKKKKKVRNLIVL